MTGRGPVLASSAVSHCRVDAAGVTAEWVEARAATLTQPTFVYFVRGHGDGEVLEAVRPAAGDLAVATGARLFTVDCPTVAHGITAYRWLLAEGCDLDGTAFIDDGAMATLATEMHLEICRRGLRSPVHGTAPWI